MSNIFLPSERGSLLYYFHWEKKNWSINRMNTVTTERCNTHTLYPYVKGITPKTIKNI